MKNVSRRIRTAAVVASISALVGCGFDSDKTSGRQDTTTKVAAAFDPCTDLSPGFVQEYSLRGIGIATTENDVPGCEYDRAVAKYSRVFVALYDPSVVKANHVGLPPAQKTTISEHPAETIGWRQRPSQGAKQTCSVEVKLDRYNLLVLTSEGLLQLPDEDYACRRAVEMTEDLIRMIDEQK